MYDGVALLFSYSHSNSPSAATVTGRDPGEREVRGEDGLYPLCFVLLRSLFLVLSVQSVRVRGHSALRWSTRG